MEQVLSLFSLLHEHFSVAAPEDGQTGHWHVFSLHVCPMEQALSKYSLLHEHDMVAAPEDGQASYEHTPFWLLPVYHSSSAAHAVCPCLHVRSPHLHVSNLANAANVASQVGASHAAHVFFDALQTWLYEHGATMSRCRIARRWRRRD